MVATQLPPPANWQDFESLCRDLFAAEWGDPETEKHGRPGQQQHGVDVIGLRDGRYWAAQCKLRRVFPETYLSRSDVLAEVEAAKKFKSPLKALVIATTGPLDGPIQDLARELSDAHAKNGLFRVLIWDWSKITEGLSRHPSCAKWEERLLASPEPRDPKSGLGAIPTVPVHHLERHDDVAALKQLLLKESGAVGVTGTPTKTGLIGMGGIGKTVLASVLASDPDVAAAFPKGVLWLTLGQTPRLTELQGQLARALGEKDAGITGTLEGRRVLQACLRDRQVLVVLDDVWDPAHAHAFDVFEAPAQVIVTTRNAEILAKFGAKKYRVDVLSKDASLELLARWSECAAHDLPVIAADVAKACGYLPLALAMVGAMVRRRPTGWEDALARIERVQLDRLASPSADYDYPDLMRALAASIDALDDGDRGRYLELAVFPEDVVVPEATLVTLWSAAGLDELDSRDLLDRLEDRSLLRRTRSGDIQLHDLQGDYIRHQVADGEALHARLVDSYAAQCESSFPSGPNDGYFFECLPEHLVAANREEELRELLLTFAWLKAKLEATNVQALLRDYRTFARDEEILFLRDSLTLIAHILAKDKSQLAQQLPHRTLLKPNFLRTIRIDATAASPRQSLVPRFPQLLDQAGSSAALRALEGHTAGVFSVAVLDGGRVISASQDHTLRVWDLETGETLRTLEGHTDCVFSVAVLGGDHVVSASADHTLRVWDVATGDLLITFEGHIESVNSVAVLGGNRVISASADHTLRVWDVATGEFLITLEGHTESVNSVAVLGGDRVISASTDHTLRVWDVATGEMLQTLEGHTDCVFSVAVLGGDRVISASYDGTSRLWDVAAGVTLLTFETFADGEYSMAGLGGDRVASPWYRSKLQIWDLATGKVLRFLEGHTGQVRSVAALGADRVVSASDDYSLRVWDLATDGALPEGHTGIICSIAVLGGGRAVSSSNDRTFRLWDLATGETRVLGEHSGWVSALEWLGGDRVVFSSYGQPLLRVWDVRTGETLRTLEGHTQQVGSVAFLGGGLVVSASDDKTLRVWDVRTGETLRTLEGHTQRVRSVAFLGGGLVVSASDDKTLRVWDVETGEALRTVKGHTSWIRSVTALGEHRVVSASNDGTLRVWDVETGETLRIFEGRAGLVESVASLGGELFVTGSKDHTLRVWDAATGEMITCLYLDSCPRVLAVTAECTPAVVAGDDRGRIHLLDLLESEPSSE